jgi:hypothetical protein
MQPHYKKLLFRSRFLLHALNTVNFFRVHKRFPANPPRTLNDFFFHNKTRLAHDPLRIFISDKEFVKLYIKAIVGEEYNVPTIAILRSKVEATAFFQQYQGEKFVVKPTHMCGKCLFGKGQLAQSDIDTVCSWFDIDYFAITGEANYRYLAPKLIVEEFINFDGEDAPKDYKIFCAKGKPFMVQVTEGRFGNHQRAFYSAQWQKLPYPIKKMKEGEFQKPDNFIAMLEIAEQLSSAFDVIRVDLFSDGNSLKVGELTNVHSNAAEAFLNPKDDLTIGKGIRSILQVN